MKVLFVLPTFFPEINGASIRMRGLIEGLKEHNVIVDVLTLGEENKSYEFEGIKVHSVNKNSSILSRGCEKFTKFNPELYLRLRRKLFKVLEEREYDLIHTRHPFHLYKACLDAKNRFKTSMVFECHRLLSHTEYQLGNYNKIWYKFILWIEKSLLNNTDYIITLSNKSRQNLKNLGVDNKIGIVGNSSYFSLLNIKDRVDVVTKYSLKGKKILLYAGTFRENEGLELLVKMMKYLPNEYKLVFVGHKNNYYRKLHKLAKKMDVMEKILFTGRVEDEEVYSFFKEAYLFVYPRLKNLYHSDFIGLKFYDAVTTKLPVITQKVGILSSLIQEHKLGINIDSDSPEHWANTIKEVNNKNFQKTMKDFKQGNSWKNRAEDLLEFYKEII